MSLQDRLKKAANAKLTVPNTKGNSNLSPNISPISTLGNSSGRNSPILSDQSNLEKKLERLQRYEAKY